MAGDDLERIAGVRLAGDSRLTWVIAEHPVEPDSLVVVDVRDEQRVGKVAVPSGRILSGAVEPEGRIAGPATADDLKSAASLSATGDERLGGIGRLVPPPGEAEAGPLFEEFNAELPRLGDPIPTELGDGIVVRLNVTEAQMIVQLDSGDEVEMPRKRHT